MRGTLNEHAKAKPPPLRRRKVVNQRASSYADVALGMKIRARRSELGMSQSELGGKLGVSFQQVQKYEKGVNRVTAPRLQQIALVLNCNISFFLDDSGPAPSSAVQEFIMSRDGLDMIKAMIHVRPEIRRKLIELARALNDADVHGDE